MRVSNAMVRRRLWLALIIGTIIFGALLLRLAYVQLWIGPELAEKAEDSWRREIPVTAKRGEIWDRNGLRLTYNVTTPTVMAIPSQIEDADSTAQFLANVLDASPEKLRDQLTKRESIVKLQPEGRKVSLEIAKEIRELELPGIVVAEDNARYYPFGNLASHILGFTGIDNQGLTGAEATFQKHLQGIEGNVAYLADASGREMPNSSERYVEPRDGLHLQLTIDKNIQAIMERELDQAMVQLEANSVIGIAMDPNNGEVLAMASRPDYEPENFRDYPSEAYNRNLPIWMTYEPGSTFKIITLAAALEEGKVDLHEDQFFDAGFTEVGGARLRCWKKGGHGSQTFLEVVENSCNPGFVTLGQRLGTETLFDYIRQFGFGKKTGIELSGEASGILFKPENVGPVELATTSFGQGVSVTPIQQVSAVSAAINGGYLYKPSIAKAWIHPETGDIVEELKPELIDQIISQETSEQVREALESVVAKGTGGNAFVDGFRVGGKTGTAQKVVDGRYSPTEHIVSFIGFAPADDPQIVIYIAVDNPKGIQFGGVVAAPIVQSIMADSLRYMDVEPREDQIDKEYKYGDIKLVEVPDFIGMTATDIYSAQTMSFRLVRSGKGSTVVSQSPRPGARVELGSDVRVYFADPPDDTDAFWEDGKTVFKRLE